jgi:hypothetical protein
MEEAVVERNVRPRWDDERLMTLMTEVLDGEEPPWSSVQAGRSAEPKLADVVAAGRAAYCWLDTVVTLRSIT